jgi:hypothetical protein
MIALAADCLLFQLAGGESVPLSSEMISVDLMGETRRWFDSDMVNQAAKAVFHYFKHDLGLQTVTIGDFAGTLEKVLNAFALNEQASADSKLEPLVPDLDLFRLARTWGEGGELFFFPRLREEVRQSLEQGRQVLRFRGLRGCVKHLIGARRWSLRCRELEEQILAYLHRCLGAENRELAMVVVE